jgi:heme/copper-type cytochrome/quinol oxidase subunit 3
MEQQREAGTLGMWVFLVTEIMFFRRHVPRLYALSRAVSGGLRQRQ